MRDEASGLFMGLQVEPSEAVALRGFDFALSQNDVMRFRPEDFSLWRVGTWNNTSGVIDACDPTLVKRGVKNARKG